jgi:hypothetical protein
MSQTMTSAVLNDTVVTRWRRRLTGNMASEKRHWRTKTAYYRAASQLVNAGCGAQLSWRSIVAAVRPRGCRSTFYEVAGEHARHPLIGDLISDGRVDSIQLALCYRRTGAVDQLLDETKVWSYWPYRNELLSSFESEPLPTDAMAEACYAAVSSWACGHPWLAAALNYAPPASAVEDLLVISSGQLSAVRAFDLVTRRIGAETTT